MKNIKEAKTEMNSLKENLLNKFEDLLNEIAICDPDLRIEIFNEMRRKIHEESIIKDPVSNVQWVKAEKVEGNTYNPNEVAPPEMELLELSIDHDGFTQPIVCYYNEKEDTYTVVDGFHRKRVGVESKKIRKRMRGYLPIVVINKPLDERMASTIRHNRARGKHAVLPMSKVVANLSDRGWDDERIGKELGMEPDEVLRLKQRTGIKGLFEDRDFSKSWVPLKKEEKESE
jgi:ParB-like chromosome segregation protein Spo0J